MTNHLNDTIDIEAFVWSYSNCPQEGNRDGEVIPDYTGHHGSFNSVGIFTKESIPMDEVLDDFGDWCLIPISNVLQIDYESCSGSCVVINRVGNDFVVVHTQDVGPTTVHRLREAGYQGSIIMR